MASWPTDEVRCLRARSDTLHCRHKVAGVREGFAQVLDRCFSLRVHCALLRRPPLRSPGRLGRRRRVGVVLVILLRVVPAVVLIEEPNRPDVAGADPGPPALIRSGARGIIPRINRLTGRQQDLWAKVVSVWSRTVLAGGGLGQPGPGGPGPGCLAPARARSQSAPRVARRPSG